MPVTVKLYVPDAPVVGTVRAVCPWPVEIVEGLKLAPAGNPETVKFTADANE